jgi:DNA-binding response OmpR family regulator
MSELKVLLVDDDEEFMRALAEHIDIWGVRWEVATTGEMAVGMIEEDPPDIMVLDLMLPGMGGLEVLERVKPELPDLQIIILTGQRSDGVEVDARRLGAFDYLRKPVQIGDLMESVKKAAAAKLNPAG